jgi:serine/threonine-protein kinase
VQLYDFGVTEDGALYYVMELLRGLDLDTLIEKYGPPPPGRTVHILHQICDSLSEAHGVGLIHRDIKPANIYLCRLGSRYDFAKLLDFGLVKSTDTTAERDTRLTMPNTTAGTPAFMAPEMVTGNHEITGQSDIYSLGCVAYLLLTGKMVFGEGTPMQIAFAHANTAPDPPSMRTELEIPARLEEAVLSCLEKNPSNRPRTADDLARLLDGVVGPSGWTQDHAREWWEAHLPDLATQTLTRTLDAVRPGSPATS